MPSALFPESDTTHLLAELGVVFLLFTLGLEFSWPRMVALRREVFGLGSLQVFGTAAVVALIARRSDSAGRSASCSAVWWP